MFVPDKFDPVTVLDAATDVGVIAPSVSVIAGVVVALATVPEIPFAEVTETEVTDPKPVPDPLVADVILPLESTIKVGFVYVPAVTPDEARVVANEPVPAPVTSPVSVIVWSPVFVPDKLDADNVPVKIPFIPRMAPVTFTLPLDTVTLPFESTTLPVLVVIFPVTDNVVPPIAPIELEIALTEPAVTFTFPVVTDTFPPDVVIFPVDVTDPKEPAFPVTVPVTDSDPPLIEFMELDVAFTEPVVAFKLPPDVTIFPVTDNVVPPIEPIALDAALTAPAVTFRLPEIIFTLPPEVTIFPDSDKDPPPIVPIELDVALTTPEFIVDAVTEENVTDDVVFILCGSVKVKICPVISGVMITWPAVPASVSTDVSKKFKSAPIVPVG